ncbi:MAG: hypothetical protein IJE84_04885 [Clostridia bacterium]|nr:hypothetical protein [Clostridia bacterium]
MSFSKIDEPLDMPNLIEVQKNSYKWFVEEGIMDVLHDVSPITDYSGNLVIEFVGYSLDEKPQYPVEECKDRDVNYAAPLKVNVHLTNKTTGEVKESEIHMGDFPLMTESGTFVINGAERVIVSQFVRSPGVYYGSSIDKTGKHLYTATVIPYRGAWLEYETDQNDVFYVKIDKTRKIPITVFLRAMGIATDEELVSMFGDDALINATFEKDDARKEALAQGTDLYEEALKEVYKKLRPGEPPLVESAQILVNNLFFDPKRYDLYPVGRYKYDKKLSLAKRIEGRVASRPIVSAITGEILCDADVVIGRAQSRDIERAGACEAYIYGDDGREYKIFSNYSVYPEAVLGYDLREAGVNHKVNLAALNAIIEEAEGDADKIKELARERYYDLCPKHITKDDIFASVN